MKKAIVSLILIAVGSGMWWVVSRSARFSIKKWDAKFQSVLRSSLNELGVTDKDVRLSVNEIRKGVDGEWVTHRLNVKMPDPKKRQELEESLSKSGARVQSTVFSDKMPGLVVKRGLRTYQEIRFTPN